MRRVPKDVIEKARRLRATTFMSTPQIARAVGVCNHTAYKVLKGRPWCGTSERGGKRATYTDAEVATIKRMWPVAKRVAIEAALPGRAWGSIGHKASALKLKRNNFVIENTRRIEPVCLALRAERERQGLTRVQLSEKSGYHVGQLCCWETGKTMPMLIYVREWAAALGLRIDLVKIGSFR